MSIIRDKKGRFIKGTQSINYWKDKKFTDEHKNKISEGTKKHILEHPEFKEKISKKLTGIKRLPFTKEHREKIGLNSKGKKASDETKKKMSLSRLGDKHPNWQGGGWRYQRKMKLKYKTDKCDICGTLEEILRQPLCYDHDHKTGEFRGWICASCNLALGHARDNVEILESMIKYIVKNR